MTPLLTDGARDALSLSLFDKFYQTLAQELQRVYYKHKQRYVDLFVNRLLKLILRIIGLYGKEIVF